MLDCYIIDDELPAINIIESFIKKTSFLNLIGSTTNAIQAYPLFKANEINLLFLDIQMPDITGIQFLENIDISPMVIFTTAYDQYALKGYELDVLDYLVKPIPYNRFLKASNKALNLYTKTQLNINQTVKKEKFLFIKSEYKTIKILTKEILYVEGLKDYVKIYTTNGRFLTRLNLKGMTAKLSDDAFIRVHRSYIVSLSKVSSFQKSQLFIGDKSIPIGDSYKSMLMDRLT